MPKGARRYSKKARASTAGRSKGACRYSKRRAQALFCLKSGPPVGVVDKRQSRMLRVKDRAYMVSVPTHLVRDLGWEAGDEITMDAVAGLLVAKRRDALSKKDTKAVEDYVSQARKAIEKTMKGAAEERRTEPVDKLDFDPLDRLEIK